MLLYIIKHRLKKLWFTKSLAHFIGPIWSWKETTDCRSHYLLDVMLECQSQYSDYKRETERALICLGGKKGKYTHSAIEVRSIAYVRSIERKRISKENNRKRMWCSIRIQNACGIEINHHNSKWSMKFSANTNRSDNTIFRSSIKDQ
jgi:hypothetical protein